MKTGRECLPAYRVPIADALIKLSSQMSSSFHALPICGGRSIQGSQIAHKYEEVFGTQLFNSELTVTGSHFDSFFFGKKEIKEAEDLAASLFAANGTFFVTVGTTVSNQIALDTLYDKGSRVLMDKSCHQSLHFGLRRCNADVDYLQPVWDCRHSGKSVWSLDDMLRKTLQAKNEGRPFDLIVLNAHSYDGIVYDIPRIIRHLLENGVTARRFLIDEAWGAANYFNSCLKSFTAMAARPLLAAYPDLQIVSTQSAHKSLSCLRQASMIHYCGDEELGERLRLSRFRLHTTSPNYPILASLDLARAQMQMEGNALTERANALARRFTELLQECDILRMTLQDQTSLPEASVPYVQVDPTKISVNMDPIGVNALEAKEWLFQNYGFYINRNTETSLLFNFHIGIHDECVDRLAHALRQVAISEHSLLDRGGEIRPGSFVIPYPPGVPLVVPGEAITPAIQQQIRAIKRSGAHVFFA